MPAENVPSASPEGKRPFKIDKFEAKTRHFAFADSQTVRKGGVRETAASEAGTTGTNAPSIANRSSSSLGPSSKTPTILERLRMVRLSQASRVASRSRQKSRPTSATRARGGALASARSFTNASLGRSQFLASQQESRPRTPGSNAKIYKSPLRLYSSTTLAPQRGL